MGMIRCDSSVLALNELLNLTEVLRQGLSDMVNSCHS
jgi:hypothetical protein